MEDLGKLILQLHFIIFWFVFGYHFCFFLTKLYIHLKEVQLKSIYIPFAFFTFHHKIQKKKWATNMMEKLSLLWPKLVWSSNQVDKHHLAALFLSERSVIFDIWTMGGEEFWCAVKKFHEECVDWVSFFFSGHWLFKIVCFNPSSSLFMFWKTTSAIIGKSDIFFHLDHLSLFFDISIRALWIHVFRSAKFPGVDIQLLTAIYSLTN